MAHKIHGLDEVFEVFMKLEDKFSPSEQARINLKRGLKFRQFVIDKLQSGQLDLEPIKDPSHFPLYNTGDLAEEIEVKLFNDGKVRVGYFSSNGRSPANSKLTYSEIANLQSNGFNAKGTIVPPRPFLQIAARIYKYSGRDARVRREQSG